MQLTITAGSSWLDTGNGDTYTVICVANEGADEGRKEEYPVTVVYRGPDGRIWTKTIERFLAKKTPIPNRTYATLLLSAAASSGNEGAIRLAAILAGAEPCPGCGYVWYRCRCKDKEVNRE